MTWVVACHLKRWHSAAAGARVLQWVHLGATAPQAGAHRVKQGIKINSTAGCPIATAIAQFPAKQKKIHMHKIRAKTQQRGLLLSVRPVTTSQALRLRPRCHVARRQELSDGRNRCGAPALTHKGPDLQTSWLEGTGQSIPAHLDPQGLVFWPELLCKWTHVGAPCSGCFVEVVTVVTHA